MFECSIKEFSINIDFIKFKPVYCTKMLFKYIKSVQTYKSRAVRKKENVFSPFFKDIESWNASSFIKGVVFSSLKVFKDNKIGKLKQFDWIKCKKSTSELISSSQLSNQSLNDFKTHVIQLIQQIISICDLVFLTFKFGEYARYLHNKKMEEEVDFFKKKPGFAARVRLT